MKNAMLFLALMVRYTVALAQNVGVGTTVPHANALLHVELGSNYNKGLLVTGIANGAATVPNLGQGNRLMYYPGKGAFRVGFAFSNYWDDGNVGLNSFAAGSYTIASGTSSTAMGVSTMAMGYNALAFGMNTIAAGGVSTAMGQGSAARGDRSFASGYYTIAKGFASTVIGVYNDSVLTGNQEIVAAATPLFIVGNGDAHDDRSNALLVRKDGNIGIGTSSPNDKVAIVQTGLQNGLSVTMPATVARGISVVHTGSGPAVYASSAMGHAIWGVASSNGVAAVRGDHTYGEAILGRTKGAAGIGAVVGVNDSSGYGVRGVTNQNGVAVFGQAGGGLSATGKAGVFQNFRESNENNTLEAITNGIGAAAFFTNTNTGPALVTGQGNVGIGNADPAFALDISGRVRLRGGGSNGTSAGIWLNNINNSGQLGFMGVYDNNYIGWYGTGGAAWNLMMNINNGYIGIGTQNPTQKLHVNGNICYTGSIAACSDIRYKKNISPLSNALDDVMNMHAIYYNWDKEKFTDKSFTDERQLGFSAQEIQQLFPEIVQKDSEGYMAVDYSRLTPVLVEAIKEQQEQISKQQQQLHAISKENQELKSILIRLESLIANKAAVN